MSQQFFFLKITSSIVSAMANSELARAIQAYKNCLRDRKSRRVSGFGSCFLRSLKNRAVNYIVIGQLLHSITHPVQATLS